MKKAVIFDLDGTLLNTLDDLADSMNYALEKHGLPTHETQAYKYFVGNGMSALATRVLPAEMRDNEQIHSALLRTFLDRYAEHSLDKTEPYIGIRELLSSLSKSGVKIAVLTNKAQPAATKVISHFFPDAFDLVVGQSETVKTKPDPSGVRMVMKTLGVDRDDCLFIGDSSVDMQTAKNAEIESVGVLWGFRTEEELRESGACHIASKTQDVFDIAIKEA